MPFTEHNSYSLLSKNRVTPNRGVTSNKNFKYLRACFHRSLTFLMVLNFVCILKRLNFNTMFLLLCSYVNFFMRLRPVVKCVRCLQNF
jgi:hypothetical protein